jgi:hypothetical protein
MTKWILAAIIVAVLWGGAQLFFYWEKVKNEEETEKKTAAAAVIVPEQLPGINGPASQQLEKTLKNAVTQGPAAVKNWLKTNDKLVQDPRRAWIELDYAVQVSTTDIAEAKRVFAQVKARTSHTSPVWPRIKTLEKTYE